MAFLSMGPDLPSVEITIDITNSPTSTTRTWTDITPYVRAFSISRGRQNELEQTSPGTLRLVLSNMDRRFDPTYTAGPYYPNVLPNRRIRARAQWATVTYNLFHGYTNGYPQEWPGDGFDAVVQVIATDVFKVLNLSDLGGKSYPSQTTDARLGTVFYDVGLGTADYSLQAGKSTVAASGTIASGSGALAHSQDVTQSENGVLFVDGGGTIVFQNRHFRSTSRTVASGTIGDAAGEIPYVDPVVPSSEDKLWNQAAVTPAGGTAETAVDAASTAEYYSRSLRRSVLVSSQSEALSCAQYLVGRYKDPQLEVTGVTLVGAAATANWPKILSLEISDRYAFRRRPPGGGTIAMDEFVESVQIDVDPERDWRTRLSMSPVTNEVLWVLDVSALDSTTRLTY
jgi:hypothetical protein